jgi:hypothetical protein
MSPQPNVTRDTTLGQRSALLFYAVVADRQV